MALASSNRTVEAVREEIILSLPVRYHATRSGIANCIFLNGEEPINEEPTDAVLVARIVLIYLDQLGHYLLGNVFVLLNLIQIPAVVLTGGAAWLVCRPMQGWISRWVERVPEHRHLDWIAHHRPWIKDRLVSLITPVAWAIGLWIAVAVAKQEGWPHLVTQIAVSLLLAWLVIRLAADLVPYAALARLIAVLAWVVAALNIVHLLGPALDLLDSVALQIGGLRVSILSVLRGVVSLAVLLWAATWCPICLNAASHVCLRSLLAPRFCSAS